MVAVQVVYRRSLAHGNPLAAEVVVFGDHAAGDDDARRGHGYAGRVARRPKGRLRAQDGGVRAGPLVDVGVRRRGRGGAGEAVAVGPSE